jgi:hypothetical protein
VRTLIPKLAEGIFDVIATFNKTNEYVLYYHSGRKTIRYEYVESNVRMRSKVVMMSYSLLSNQLCACVVRLL